jgi:hypothetical protein
MEFKFDARLKNEIIKSSIVPEHLQWVLQPGYIASYAEGSFGKLLGQRKMTGDYELRIYYIEIWKPTDFAVISDKRFNTIFCSFKNDFHLDLSEGTMQKVVMEGGVQVLSLSEYPNRHFIRLHKQGFYLSWHLSASLKYEKLFRRPEYLHNLTERLLPKIDFSLPGKYKYRVPLAK